MTRRITAFAIAVFGLPLYALVGAICGACRGIANGYETWTGMVAYFLETPE